MYRIGERREPRSRIEVSCGFEPRTIHKERFPYNTTDFIFLAFTLCLRFGLLSFTVVKKEKFDKSKRETFMGVYRRGSVKPVPLTVSYWFRVRRFESSHSHRKASKGDYKSLGRNLLRGIWIGVAPLSTSKRVLLIGNIFLTLVH